LQCGQREAEVPQYPLELSVERISTFVKNEEEGEFVNLHVTAT
jgi:hypothetical protein